MAVNFARLVTDAAPGAAAMRLLCDAPVQMRARDDDHLDALARQLQRQLGADEGRLQRLPGSSTGKGRRDAAPFYF